MKKILIGIITVLTAAACVFGAACGKNTSFTAPGFSDFGKVVSQNGFVTTTDNYVLFINGAADSSSDNSYGAPVKGSLMAIKTQDFVDGKYGEAKVIVPKLFAATDYTAGFAVSGEYVYYGTPSTDKNSSGEIASDEIAFMKSKIDGTEKPQKLFDYSALSVSYRIINTDNGIYIVYYDSDDTALKVYSEKTGATEVIAATDAKTNAETNGKYLSLDGYKFVENANAGDFAVIYTVTVYNEKYYEEKAEQDSYSRSTESYNYVYAYKAGDAKKDGDFAGTRVLDGEKNSLKYSLTLVKNGYAFYKETDLNSSETTKGVAVKDFADASKHEKIKNTTLVADTSLIINLEEVYALSGTGDEDSSSETSAQSVYKYTLIGNSVENDRKVILETEDLSSILFKNGDYLYFYNSSNNIIRIKLDDADANVERVSLGAANASWYKPAVITVSGKDYLAYSDATTEGSSYVYVADLSKTATAEDTDDDGENDLFYIDGVTLLGKMTAEDTANKVAAAVSEIGETLELSKKDDGTLYCEAYDAAQKVYDELDEESKTYVSDENLTTLENCKKAVELANKYNKLSSVADYDDMSDNEKTEFKSSFEQAQSARKALIAEAKDGSVFETVCGLIEEEYKYYYQEAAKKLS